MGFDGSDHPVSEGLLCLLAPRYQTYQRHQGRRMKGEKERKKRRGGKKKNKPPLLNIHSVPDHMLDIQIHKIMCFSPFYRGRSGDWV